MTQKRRFSLFPTDRFSAHELWCKEEEESFQHPQPSHPRPRPQRYWLSPGAPNGIACGCSVPGQELQPHEDMSQQILMELAVFPSCLLAVAPATPIAQRNSKRVQIYKS